LVALPVVRRAGHRAGPAGHYHPDARRADRSLADAPGAGDHRAAGGDAAGVDGKPGGQGRMISNRSMPEATVIPQLGYADVGAAAEWLEKAFGFTVRLRIGDHRIQMNVGDGAVVLTNTPNAPKGSVMVRIAGADAHHARAKAAGATVSDPQTWPYGERQYS